MIQSFRLRLALLSALLTGVALLLFGAGSWWLIRESKIQRMDSELRAYAEREVNRVRSTEEWQAEELRIANGLGLRDVNDVALLLQDAAGTTVYQSGHWPSSWSPEKLPWPTSTTHAEEPRATPSLMGTAMAAPGPEGPPPNGHGAKGPRPPPWERGIPPPGAPPPAPNPPLAPPDAPQSGKPGRGPGPALAFAQLQADGATWRIALARIDVAQLALAVNARAIEADMRGIRNAFLLSLPLALLLTGVASWVFANRAMAPINKLARVTRSVTAGGLDKRIASAGEDREFVALIDVFNGMLGRLERSFQQAHRFTADAAHELKTPLAIVQGQLERAIQQAEDGSAMQTGLSSILDEVRRLSVISRKLLLLSQADAGHLAVLRETVDISKMLDELLEDTRMLAPHLRVDAAIQPGLLAKADPGLLRQVLHNLISNAIKYNMQGGWIRIALTGLPHGGVEVVVSNASAGIAPANRARLFERFFRADQAHSRNVEGVGLGLSVSREIARAHGGDLTLQGEHQGAVAFALMLPA